MTNSLDGDSSQSDEVALLTDPFVQKYLKGRDDLIQQEKMRRSDYHFKQNLTSVEAEACAIVDQVRFEEQQILWTPEYEDHLASDTSAPYVYPGMMFSLAKERMEKSKLWRIVRKMPKGALLHCHLEAMVEADWLLEQAFAQEDIHIMATEPLDTEAARLERQFSFGSATLSQDQHPSIWSKEYQFQTKIPLNVAADTFPDGGRAGFINWVKSRASITPEESIAHHHGPNEIWTKFLSCFRIVHALVYHEAVFPKYISRMCQQLYSDGIQYADVRAVFYDPTSNDPSATFAGWFQAISDEVEAFKNSEEGKGFWGLRIIWTAVRHQDTPVILQAMRECIKIKKQFPELIAGFDFVGQEDLGRPLQELVPEILWFRSKCVQENIDIPFFFHAGETLGDGTPTDENLFDAVLLGTRRIGHGFSLFKHPLLIDIIKDRKILVESCPVSNEVLRLTSSIMSHPLPALLARGVPVSLCNDDPAMLGQGTTGCTHDYWQALQAWDNLGLGGLGSLAENSVRWAAFEDCSQKDWNRSVTEGAAGTGLRAERMKEWRSAWEQFCQWVVTEHGADRDFEGGSDSDVEMAMKLAKDLGLDEVFKRRDADASSED
ncbi:Metallo-dependent hydrolase [Trichodelitschia bisporula]|uniref:adenosine deaminase n=1 Tax=Trichodelitschia bisporula TaxID=703511 RepID=A0A6G1I0V2_9PEZI|nr:Metallo-dependent hydrolase [Trichodelitschia bisporula]